MAEENAFISIENLNGASLDQEQCAMMMSKNREFQRSMVKYKAALLKLETKFNILNLEFSMKHDRNPIESIKTRLKSPDSIMQKMKKKGLPFDIGAMETSLMDIAGVRIIAAFEEDVYFLAEALKAQNDIEVVSEKDYIRNPKPNGYRSLHVTVRIPVFFAGGTEYVPVEIQFRTIAMDFWASLEHELRYKKNLKEIEMVETQLKKCAASSMEWDKKMEALMHLIFEQRGKNDEDQTKSG